MKYFNHVLILILLCSILIVNAAPYTIDGDSVYIDDANVYMSATPHTVASSGWVYFNFTSKVYNNDIDMAWGFNTTASKPTKAELYAPHWVNTTSQHSHTFYNVSSFVVYTGDVFDYGNVYNTNYSYSTVHEVITYNESTMDPNGTEWATSNVSFDSFVTDGTNYTTTWHTRHDSYVLWNDYSHSFTVIDYEYQGYNKWYYVKNLPISSGVEYTMRTWVEVPVGLSVTSGKYYVAVKPSVETIPQAIANGHFYALDPWWNSSWGYYKSHTLNQTMINDSIWTGHYTLLVEYTDTDLITKAQSDGDDIVFTDSDNVTLPHQLSTFNATTGYVKAYVGLSDVTNVTFVNMYYGNSGATNTEDKSGTWGENASGIWLMDEGTGSYANDSSGNGNNGTIVGADWVPDGLDFVAANSDYVDISPSPLPHGSQKTIAVRVNISSDITSGIVSDGDSVLSGSPAFLLRYNANNVLEFSGGDGWGLGFDTIKSGIILNQWYDIVLTWDGTDWLCYVDGVKEYEVTATDGTIAAVNLYFASGYNAHCGGIIAKSLIYNRALSPSEVATQYNNTEYPTHFISVGAEQSEVPTGGTPVITSWENDKTSNNTSDITINISETVNFNATANQSITTWNWYKDTVDQSNNYDNITLDWSTAGLKHVAVNATNVNGTSNTKTWNVTVESAGDTTPPLSIIGLTNTTGNFWHNWTWSNPVTDFNHTTIYINNVHAVNTSNEYYNLTVSAHNSSEISIKTVDATGNVNTTWTNHTSIISNNAITITNTGDWSDNEGQTVNVDYNANDADSDTATFSCNRTDLFTDFSTSLGTGNWITDYTDAAVHSVDFGVSDGYSSTDNYTMTITVADYATPTAPTTLTNTSGNFWVRHAWVTGANTDTFNVSQNSSWTNDSALTYYNASLGAHGWSNITVYSYNVTSNQIASSVSQNTQLSNNPIAITDILTTYTINENDTLSIDADYTDLDSDTATFDDNSSEWNINTATGTIEWITTEGDQGIYNYEINISDGYGSIDTHTFAVTVHDSTPAAITNLQNTTGNFWINWGWIRGDNTNTFDVWIDNIDTGADITNTYYNMTYAAHASKTISVRGYNSTLGDYSGWVNQTTTIPNNQITITNSSDWVGDEGQSVYLDFDYIDADGDTGTFDTNATNGNLDTATGIYTWNTVDGDQGTYNYNFNVTDGYASVSTYMAIITIGDSTPTATSNILNSTAGLDITWNWTIGTNGDYTEVNINDTWKENSNDNEYVYTALPHTDNEMQTRTYNATLAAYSAYTNQTTALPNNQVALSGIPDEITNQDTNLTGAFDLDNYFTDLDSDTPTFHVQSNNDSTNLTVTIQAGNTVDFNVTTGWTGSALVTFNATDGYGSTDTDAMILSIGNVSANHANFTFTNAAVNPSTILERKTAIVTIDINDSDGTINTALVNIRDVNYTMTHLTGDSWTYTYSQTTYIGKHYITHFYAQDNSSDWNSTTSNLYIDVLRASGEGVGISYPPVTEEEEIPTVPQDDITVNTTTIIDKIETVLTGDPISIFRFNFFSLEPEFAKRVYAPDVTGCSIPAISDVVLCHVEGNGYITIISKPKLVKIYDTRGDAVTMTINGTQYDTPFGITVLNFMGSVPLPSTELQWLPDLAFYNDYENGTLEGIRLWFFLVLMTFGMILIYLRIKGKLWRINT